MFRSSKAENSCKFFLIFRFFNRRATISLEDPESFLKLEARTKLVEGSVVAPFCLEFLHWLVDFPLLRFP